jgi:putative ABC transport system permease protein
MKKLNVRLLRMIKHSKGQFLSIAVTIAVALCIFMLFSNTSKNVRHAVDYYYELTNINDIQVQLVKIPQAAVSEVLSVEGIKEVQGRVSFDVPLRVENEDEKVGIRIISIPDDESINKMYPLSGKHTKAGYHDAFILEQFAKARNIQMGDSISPYINGKTYDLGVIGITANPEFVYLMENDQSLLPDDKKFGVAYVNEAFAQSVSGYTGSYNELLVTVHDYSKVDEIADKLEKALDKYGVKRIIKLEDQLSNNVLMQEIEGLDKMAAVIPVLFLTVAAIVIAIMLSRVVNNDRMAIGVMKAMGYGNMNILSHYIKYSLAMGLAGSTVGTACGILLAKPLTQYYITYFKIPLIETTIYYAEILKGILLSCIFCTASGVFGARSILRIMPADSMRPQAPRAGKRILLERIGFIWKRLPFSWKMVIRNIMRAKRRVVFLVAGLSMAYAINTVPLFLANDMPAMFTLQYGEYMKMDYSIDFARPMNENVIKDLKRLTGATSIEPKLEYPFKLKNGWREKTVNIIGVQQDTVFYEFRDSDNNIVKLKNNGIFVTETLAKSLRIDKGDKITVKNYMPGRDDVILEVAGIVKQYLGSNAYIDLGVMKECLMEKGMINGAYINSSYDIKDKLKNIRNISSVRSLEDMRDSFEEYMDLMVLATRLYMFFGGILSFAIIYNATIVSLSERNLELASLRVMGFDKRDIYNMILKENSFITMLAILFGIPLGIGMIKSMTQSFSTEMISFPMIMTPGIFVNAALATVLFVAAAQLATLKKIYNMDFIEALKSRIS